jgi:hypothetical protein
MVPISPVSSWQIYFTSWNSSLTIGTGIGGKALAGAYFIHGGWNLDTAATLQ